MATYKDKRSGQWRYRARVKLPDGSSKRISGTSKLNTKRDAERAERAHIERVLSGEPEEKDIPTVDAFAKEFLAVYARNNNKPTEVAAKESNLRVHLLPAFGSMRLDEIGAREIEHYKAEKAAEVSAGTVKNHLITLSTMLRVAKKWGILDTVPVIEWPKVDKPSFDFLTFDEADALLADLDTPRRRQWHAMILVMLRTGMRVGEACALRWEDVDLINGRITIALNVSRVKVDGKYQDVVGTPKGGRSREVPLSGQALAALRSLPQRGETVFPDSKGGILSRDSWAIHAASERALGRKIGWHVLRHTFASHLVMRGVSLKAVQELMGHASIEDTMRYAHLSPAAKESAVALLDAPAPSVAPVDDECPQEAAEEPTEGTSLVAYAESVTK